MCRIAVFSLQNSSVGTAVETGYAGHYVARLLSAFYPDLRFRLTNVEANECRFEGRMQSNRRTGEECVFHFSDPMLFQLQLNHAPWFQEMIKNGCIKALLLDSGCEEMLQNYSLQPVVAERGIWACSLGAQQPASLVVFLDNKDVQCLQSMCRPETNNALLFMHGMNGVNAKFHQSLQLARSSLERHGLSTWLAPVLAIKFRTECTVANEKCLQ
eukprot:ANDGO_02926.mRNA.1 hypothetical protein